ncbi:MAG: type II secretion protein [Deltaproteobacteria bacterium]|nr:type II secretion protein [Deltaproteobacteria bacterium]
MKVDKNQNPFSCLVAQGVLSATSFAEACRTAADYNLPLAQVLLREYDLPRRVLQKALSVYYNCPVIEYDERLPVPPELITCGVKCDQLRAEGWFPLIKEGDGSIVIACTNPADEKLPARVAAWFGPGPCAFHVCLPDDVIRLTEAFMHAKPGHLIGTERTGLAFWRNTMAQWRTLLACYRTDLAQSRTALAVSRAGLSLITITFAYFRIHKHTSPIGLLASMMLIGCILGVIALPAYFKVRRSRLKPPAGQTLMEVTAAVLLFIENYHFLAAAESQKSSRDSMLARLSDFLREFCTIFYPSPSSLERTHLARERNLLAALRTISACNRTIYARARTGLAFMRTGAAFMSIGIGLNIYFGIGLDTIFYGVLVLIGVLLIFDGALWYIPTFRQQVDVSGLGSRFQI